MAQVQALTNEGFTELGKILAGEASSLPTKIVNIKATFTCDATATYIGVTKATEDGLAIAAGTCSSVITTVANDTLQVTKEFTVGAGVSVTLYGFGLVNTDADVMFMSCLFNAAIPVEAGDKITNTAKIQVKAD